MPELIAEKESMYKIHPHKFAMWVAMGSIVMMFAGLTSAYIVRASQGNWRIYDLPNIFWLSTAFILISSVTMQLAVKAYKTYQFKQFKLMMVLTILLGLGFALFQYWGFYQLYHQAIPVKINGNPSESFLFIIAGLHLLHILGGIIALIIIFFIRNSIIKKKIKTNTTAGYRTAGLEVVATYWHFVDALWIYLFLFLLVNK